jgi:hypothetical protein
VEKIEELACRAHFSGRSQFGNLGSRTFQIHFEESNGSFGGQNFVIIASNPLIMFYTLRPFNDVKNTSIISYADVIPLAS